MGSCISKCRPKEKPKQDSTHVHDKLVISQHPISPPPAKIPIIPSSEKPLSPLPLTPSFSSFSCSNSSKCTMASSISSSASSSTCSSSTLRMNDRYYSNEILWSRGDINLAINQNHGLRKAFDSNGNKIYGEQSPLVSKAKQSIQEHAAMPKKRARTSSPTLVRQKSFRKEQNHPCSIPNRGQRSPSPSRRFKGDYGGSVSTSGTTENSSRRRIASKTSYGVKKDGFQPPNASPNLDNMKIRCNSPARKKDSFSQQVSTKTDNTDAVEMDVVVKDITNRDNSTNDCNIPARRKDIISKQVSTKNDENSVAVEDRKEMDIVMEDINNPHIALDCFIFL